VARWSHEIRLAILFFSIGTEANQWPHPTVEDDGIRPAIGMGDCIADAIRNGDGVFGFDLAAGFA
jgi:hypothetical protein